MGCIGPILVLRSPCPTTCTAGLADGPTAGGTGSGEAGLRLPNAMGCRGPATTSRPCSTANTCSSSPRMDINLHRSALSQAVGPEESRRHWQAGSSLWMKDRSTDRALPAAYVLSPDARCPTTWTPIDAPYPHQPYNGNPQHASGEELKGGRRDRKGTHGSIRSTSTPTTVRILARDRQPDHQAVRRELPGYRNHSGEHHRAGAGRTL